MIYEIDKYTEFLCLHKITPNQFYILWLLYTKDYANIDKYLKTSKFETSDFDYLVEKDLIVVINPNAKEYNIIHLYVSETFAATIIIEPEEAWEELFKNYPAHLLLNGTKVPAKTLTYTDSKGVEAEYKKHIKLNRFLHARVISAINVWKAANNGFATIKIDKFVMGKYWEEIERTSDASPKSRNY